MLIEHLNLCPSAAKTKQITFRPPLNKSKNFIKQRKKNYRTATLKKIYNPHYRKGHFQQIILRSERAGSMQGTVHNSDQ